MGMYSISVVHANPYLERGKQDSPGIILSQAGALKQLFHAKTVAQDREQRTRLEITV